MHGSTDWQEWTEENYPRGLFLLSWDGGWVKAWSWKDKVVIDWLGEKYDFKYYEMVGRLWFQPPLFPKDREEMKASLDEMEARWKENGRTIS